MTAAERPFADRSDRDWDDLLDQIEAGEVTPFIGAGASHPPAPLGGQLAREWAKGDDLRRPYPFGDTDQLAQVAQYLVVEDGDPTAPKKLIRKLIGALEAPDFDEPDDPHGLLADLPLPYYVTTNYDDFMQQALVSRGRVPRWGYPHWWREFGEAPEWPDGSTVEEPFVFHLHGHTVKLQSMVLTESDYLDFLVKLTEKDNDRILPPAIRTAFAETTLLFIGYSLYDWTTRVLLRAVATGLKGDTRLGSFAVNLAPRVPDRRPEDVKSYLERYVPAVSQVAKLTVFWGDARLFAAELRRRLRDRAGDAS